LTAVPPPPLPLPLPLPNASQLSVAPPLRPAQVQSHGPEPLPLSSVTGDAVPPVHKAPPEGAAPRLAPLAEPHAPLSSAGAGCAEHCAVVPLLLPAQLHDHGPLPVTLDADPVLQRPVVGALLTVAPFDEPQAPFTGVDTGVLLAVHCTAAPLLLPAQLQSHGPLPVTADAVPVLHRLIVGAPLSVAPLAEPHTPFTGVPFGLVADTHVSFCHTHQSPGPATSAIYVWPPSSTSR
jgi:hypothetical protein